MKKMLIAFALLVAVAGGVAIVSSSAQADGNQGAGASCTGPNC
jgi:hypothetical protein